MKAPLDDFFISLSEWEHIGALRTAMLVVFLLGMAGFIFYWFAAVRAWFGILRDRGKGWRGLFALGNPFNPSWGGFYRAMLKGVLWWLLAGWPLLLTAPGLASADALNVFLGGGARVSG